MIRLRTRFHSHRLMLCAQDQVARLLLACGIIDDWISVQGQACASLFAGADSVEGQLQAWLKDCDLAIGWMEEHGGTLSEKLRMVGAREAVVLSPFSSTIHAIHQRDRFLEAIQEAPADGRETGISTMPEPLLHLGQTCLNDAGVPVGSLLAVIHPGSGSAHKCVASAVLAFGVDAIQTFGAIPVRSEGPGSSYSGRGAGPGEPFCRAGLRRHPSGRPDGGADRGFVRTDRSGSLGSERTQGHSATGCALSLPVVERCQSVRRKALS